MSDKIYKVDVTKRRKFTPPLFRKVVSYEVNTIEVEKFFKRHRRLPRGVTETKGGSK